MRFLDLTAVRCVTTEGTLGVGAGWSGGLQLEASDDGTNWYRQAYQEGSNTVTSVCSRDVQPFGQEFYLQNKQYGVCLHSNLGSPGDETPIANGGAVSLWTGCSGDKNRFQKIDTGDNDGSFYLKNMWGPCLHMDAATPSNGITMSLWNGCSSKKNKFYALDTGDGDGSFFLQSKKDMSYFVNWAANKSFQN